MTVDRMLAELRQENQRMEEQLNNLIRASTIDEIFSDGATYERGRELTRRVQANRDLISGIEQAMTRLRRIDLTPEDVNCKAREIAESRTEPPESAKQFLDAVREMNAFAAFHDGRCVGTAYVPNGSFTCSHMTLTDADLISRLF